MKLGLVGSSGGHLTHLYLLKEFWEQEERFWVTFKKEDAVSLLKEERVFWCYFPTNRNIINFFKNAVLAIQILKKEKPNFLVSTGAGAAVPCSAPLHTEKSVSMKPTSSKWFPFESNLNNVHIHISIIGGFLCKQSWKLYSIYSISPASSHWASSWQAENRLKSNIGSLASWQFYWALVTHSI